MFGNNNMQELMAKAQEMQAAVEKSKERLSSIFVKGETEDGSIRFIMDGNRKLQEVTIRDTAILSPENSRKIEDMLMEAFNKALENANHTNDGEPLLDFFRVWAVCSFIATYRVNTKSVSVESEALKLYFSLSNALRCSGFSRLF
jgi:DNA-binding YbaB/EbfC family protein